MIQMAMKTDSSELAELERTIEHLRKRVQILRRNNIDRAEVKFISEWLMDLYYLRNNHPDYRQKEKPNRSANKKDILLSDASWMNVVARTEFMDPFDVGSKIVISPLVAELMDGLTTMEWEAVSMVWLSGLGPTAAGRYMGCTPKNVSTYLIRAKNKMLAKYNNVSQMVLDEFDDPPVIRRTRSKSVSVKSMELAPAVDCLNQLTMFGKDE